VGWKNIENTQTHTHTTKKWKGKTSKTRGQAFLAALKSPIGPSELVTARQ